MTTTEIIDLIIKLGALATALTAIAVLTKKIIKYFRYKEKKIDHLGEQIEILVRHDKDQYLNILRLTIMNPEMPISERLIAGEKYVEAGGNGDVKHYYQSLIKEHTK